MSYRTYSSAFCLLPSAFCLLPSAFRLLPSAFRLLLFHIYPIIKIMVLTCVQVCF
jgi:hypothetical protein